MNTKEYVNNLFTDEAIMIARSHDVNLAELASLMTIVQIPITIELPSFMAHALEVYKKDTGVKLTDLLEELILNKVMSEDKFLNKMLLLGKINEDGENR